MRRIERAVLEEWVKADKDGKRYFPHEFMYRDILRSGVLKSEYGDRSGKIRGCWLPPSGICRCSSRRLGRSRRWATCHAGHCISGDVCNVHTVRDGAFEYMIKLADWYQTMSAKSSIGFFQIGGGIAGDFPIRVPCPCCTKICSGPRFRSGAISARSRIPRLPTDLYSGAVPNEAIITWGKLGVDTLKFIIEPDRLDRRSARLRARTRLVARYG